MNLLDAFKMLLPFCDKRPATVPVLSCVQMRWSDGQLCAVAGDLECIAQVQFESSAFSGSGEAAVRPKSMINTLRMFEQEPRRVFTQPGEKAKELVLEFADGVQAVFQVETGDFLAFPDTGESKGKVDGQTWARLAQCLPPACARTNERPILQTIHLSFDEDELLAVATDSYRLHALRVSCSADQPFIANIPAGFVRRTADLFEHAPEVDLSISGNLFVLKSGAISAAIDVAEGRFPDVSSYTLLGEPLSTAIIQAGDLLKPVRMWKETEVIRLEWDQDELAYFVKMGDVKLRAAVAAQTAGKKGEVSLNRAFLQDALNHCSKLASLEWHQHFFVVRNCDDRFFAVIMPMKSD